MFRVQFSFLSLIVLNKSKIGNYVTVHLLLKGGGKSGEEGRGGEGRGGEGRGEEGRGGERRGGEGRGEEGRGGKRRGGERGGKRRRRGRKSDFHICLSLSSRINPR